MIISSSEIIDNIKIADNLWQLTFISSEIAKRYEGAGQFITISLNNNDSNILRRPMSIASVRGNEISIIYKVFGPVTTRLSKLSVGGIIEYLGPLGNTFKKIEKSGTPVLIGGGVGLAPILNFDGELRNNQDNVITIIGAKASNEHFIKHSPKENYYLSTDDGSLGIKGTVIDALDIIINGIKNPYVFACGPKIMLHYLKEYLNKRGIPGQFSIESYMACGFGFCQGCAITNDNKNGFTLVCKDGPVFDYNEVKFD